MVNMLTGPVFEFPPIADEDNCLKQGFPLAILKWELGSGNAIFQKLFANTKFCNK